MSEPDTIMTRIGEGIGLGQQGKRAAARDLFVQVWSDIGGEDGDPLHRCALAHSMADVQEDVREELLWDRRALDAVDLLTDDRAAQAGILGPAAAFYPSLHLNLGECHRKLGNTDQAREHLERGLAAVSALGEDGYGLMVKNGLDQLAARIASS